MIGPPKTQSKILSCKDEICQAFQMGERRLQKWRERGLPVKMIDGRLTGHYDSIETFIRTFVETCHIDLTDLEEK